MIKDYTFEVYGLPTAVNEFDYWSQNQYKVLYNYRLVVVTSLSLDKATEKMKIFYKGYKFRAVPNSTNYGW